MKFNDFCLLTFTIFTVAFLSVIIGGTPIHLFPSFVLASMAVGTILHTRYRLNRWNPFFRTEENQMTVVKPWIHIPMAIVSTVLSWFMWTITKPYGQKGIFSYQSADDLHDLRFYLCVIFGIVMYSAFFLLTHADAELYKIPSTRWPIPRTNREMVQLVTTHHTPQGE